MNSNGKTVKENRNYKPAHAAQPTKKTTGTGKFVKALIFGPTIATLGLTLIYIALWGFSKAFTAVHTVVTTYLVPWVSSYWPIIIGIWALIFFTSVIFHFVDQYQKETKKVKKQSVKGEQPVRKQVRKTEMNSTIYDINSDEDVSEEELESVGAYPYATEMRDFSKEIDNIIFGKTKNKKNLNPDDFISLGKPYNPEEETEA